MLQRAIEAVKLEEQTCDGDERIGLRILGRALEAPTRTIADNSGYDDGVVVDRMRAGTGNQGFDAARGIYCDLVEAGIDPTKVVRIALENAVSVAGMFLLSEATMTECEPQKPAAKPGETCSCRWALGLHRRDSCRTSRPVGFVRLGFLLALCGSVDHRGS